MIAPFNPTKVLFTMLTVALMMSSCSTGTFRQSSSVSPFRTPGTTDSDIASQELARAEATEENPETPYFGRGPVQRKTIAPRNSGVSRGL